MREYTESKLSRPVVYDGIDFEEQLQQAMDIFYNTFLSPGVKPTYQGRPIFFDMSKKVGNIVLPYPERFLHIVSLDDSDKYNVFPCTNDISFENCVVDGCETSNMQSFTLINRWECQYRLSRIHWIKEILSLVGRDANITEWCEFEKDNRRGTYEKWFIRYCCGIDDYVIILSKRINDFYFLTAFPICSKEKKNKYSLNYKKFSKK